MTEPQIMKKGVRAITNGHVIQLGPLEREKDLEHELIHVEQAEREPFIHPLLYLVESRKHGYRQNKYEDEAYTRASNEYKSTKPTKAFIPPVREE